MGEGASTSFIVVATGNPAPTYQWYVGGVLIPGATSATLPLTDVQPANAGSYKVVVTNSVSSVSSKSATLTVNTLPAITGQPASQTAVAGSNVTFSVTAAGTPAPKYQWSFDGTAIVGATRASLTLSKVTAADAGTYTVSVSNSQGTVPSSAATLAIDVAPAITAQPVSEAVNVGASASFTVVATGTPTPAYQWSLGGVPIAGATSSTLALGSVQPGAAGGYTVTVSNSVSSVTSTSATLTVNTPPSVTTQPVSQSVNPGSSVTFTVVATATPAPTYQWSLNGTALPGATASSLTLTNVTAANAGNYTVVVTNTLGFEPSAAATLAVNVAPLITSQSASQTVDEAASATFSVVATGTPAPTYQWYVGGVQIGGATFSTLALNNVQPDAAGSYTVKVANSVSSVTSAPATLTVDTPPVITTSPASQTVTTGSNVTFTAVATGIPAPTYQWSLNGTAIPGAIYGNLALYNVTLSNAGAYAVTVTNNAGVITSAGALLTVDVAPAITTQPVSQTANEGATVTFTVGATGNPAPAYQWYVGGAQIPGAVASMLTLTGVQPGNAGRYTVTAANSVSSVTSNAATLTVDASPAITTQPVSQTVAANSSVTFSVVATGTPAPTYQWTLNGAAILGATRASLTLSRVTAANDGNYAVTVTNTLGSLGSAAATLTVGAAPSITTQPASQTVAEGGTAAFAVVATGSPAPAYQWYLGGVLIPGATSSTLALADVQPGSAGSYTVNVSNSVSSVTSSAALLTVNTSLAFTTDPVSRTVVAGNNVTFTAVAMGNPAPTYQWYLNGTPIPGATKASLTIINAKAANGGTYTVTATNTFGSATSTGALLTVNVPPAITKQPASQTVAAGSNVTLTVVATGTPTLTYQWSFDGAPIPGETASTLTLTDVQAGAAGDYTVTVTNSASNVTSHNAVLKVD